MDVLSESGKAQEGDIDALDKAPTTSFLTSVTDYLSSEGQSYFVSKYDDSIRIDDSAISAFNNYVSETDLARGTEFLLDVVQDKEVMDGLGLTVGDDGRVSLVSVLSQDTINLTTTNMILPKIIDPKGVTDLFDFGSPKDAKLQSAGNSSDRISLKGVEDELTFNVRGHALWKHPSPVVELSDDIDVVFYNGGLNR